MTTIENKNEEIDVKNKVIEDLTAEKEELRLKLRDESQMRNREIS